MHAEFATEYLRCPVCRHERTLRLHAVASNEREVREGTLTCGHCGASQTVHRGVAHLLHNAPEHVAREAAGLHRFADHMRAEGWDRDLIRRLPLVDHGYWYVQGTSITQLLNTVAFQRGQSLLDVGSNTCWASNHFAVRGLRVVALDISTAELQGLYTSDYFIEDGTSYFERVLASMSDMPIVSSSLDYVYCCEVLHHNDTESLRRTLEECFRVLKPGGKLLIVNETLKTMTDPVGVHADSVEEFEGYEHAHWAARYRWEAIRAGFHTRLLEPAYHEFFGTGPPTEPRPRKKDTQERLLWEARTRPVSRWAYLNWLLNVTGGIAFGMVATKPTRPTLASLRGLRPRAERSD
jgi:SAM-dependent methyltransferase